MPDRAKALLSTSSRSISRLTLLLALIIGACASDDETSRDTAGPETAETPQPLLERDRGFRLLAAPYETPQECREANRNAVVFNCYLSLTLCRRGRFQVILTDIPNVGTCLEEDGQLLCNVRNGEVQEGTRLTVGLDDTTAVVSEISDERWEEIPAEDRVFVEDECDRLDTYVW